MGVVMDVPTELWFLIMASKLVMAPQDIRDNQKVIDAYLGVG